jgi:hypothetical protein
LDSEILSEILFSMNLYEVFNAQTGEALLRLTAHLRSEGYTHYLALMGAVYVQYAPEGLKKYLEEAAAKTETGEERHDALVKTARVILQGKKLKLASPPYGVGLAIDE